jgi:adenylate kinase family enzyme
MLTFDQLSRVAIIGTSCSGKTTFSGALAHTLAAPHIELDALQWGPNWTPNPSESFRESVDLATSAPRWVCDGNYNVVRDLVWARATAIIWLNYRFPRVFKRALVRTLSRCTRRTQIYGGNRESFTKSFLSRDSILLWVLQSHWRLRRDYLQALQDPQYEHAQVRQLKSASTADEFLIATGRIAATQTPSKDRLKY